MIQSNDGYPYKHKTEYDPLFGALVDLAKESLKDFLLQTLRLINGSNLLTELGNNLLLVLLVYLLQLKLVEEGFDLGLLGSVLAAIRSIQELALLGSAALDGLVNEPRALVVLNIGTDLANDRWVTEVVEVVILDLEVLAQRNEDVVGLLEVFLGSQLKVHKGQSDRQVEAVVSCLVGDDEHVLLHGEIVEVDVVLGGGDEVTKLTQLSLPGGLVEELDDVNVGGVRAETLLEDEVDSRLQHEGVVDGDLADTFMTVPAGFATTGDRGVHHIITDQEESLEQLSHPAQDAEVLELLLGQGLLQESKAGVRDRETTVKLTAGNIDVERLCGTIDSVSHDRSTTNQEVLLTFSNHSSALSGRL